MSDGIWKDVAEMNAMSQKAEIKPKVGERWRVTIEGEVVACTTNYASIKADDGRIDEPYLEGRTWERLPDPEPEWQPGDLVIDAEDRMWKRRNGRSSDVYPWDRDGEWFAESVPVRPLTRLIRES